MRTSAFLTASFALLALWCPFATASPTGIADVRADTPVDGVSDVALAPPTNGTLVKRAPLPYIVDCAVFPNVCENWCYYVFCHQGGRDPSAAAWTITVNRNAGMRSKSECGRISPNKCSTKAGTWPANPLANQDCDEQPKNTNDEGGANAATRCMSRTENRAEGSAWSTYINSGGPGRIADGTKIKVQLLLPLGPICASYRLAGSTVCPAPITPTTAGVAQNAIRQQ